MSTAFPPAVHEHAAAAQVRLAVPLVAHVHEIAEISFKFNDMAQDARLDQSPRVDDVGDIPEFRSHREMDAVGAGHVGHLPGRRGIECKRLFAQHMHAALHQIDGDVGVFRRVCADDGAIGDFAARQVFLDRSIGLAAEGGPEGAGRVWIGVDDGGKVRLRVVVDDRGMRMPGFAAPYESKLQGFPPAAMHVPSRPAAGTHCGDRPVSASAYEFFRLRFKYRLYC